MLLTEIRLTQMDRYVQRYFVDRATFIRRCGGSVEEVQQLLGTKAAPAVIYSQSTQGEWWSALGGYVGTLSQTPPEGGNDWYAPSAIWWVRRALLASRTGAGPENVETFIEQFMRALLDVPMARLNYASCFDGEALNINGARQGARDEWAAWVSGAYAVCLSHFSGESCVRKEVNAWRIRNHFDNDDKTLALTPIELFELTEQLASVLMPFAPFERASGTPGKALDRTLAALNLGIDEPYG